MKLFEVLEKNEDADKYAEWKKLVNMSTAELKKFINSDLGKEAGLNREQAKKSGGIKRGRGRLQVVFTGCRLRERIHAAVTAKKGSRKMKVFLGGTCNESDWRNRIIPMLEADFFNPVVDDWTPDCMAEELRQREECDVCLYVITPKMTGVYSVAEVIDDSNKRPARTVFVRLRYDGDEKFTDGQWKSLGAVAQMVERNGGAAFDSLKSAALHINAVTPNA